jgi:hypothetical protein
MKTPEEWAQIMRTSRPTTQPAGLIKMIAEIQADALASKRKRRERLCDNCVALLYLLSDIRAAIGDPTGKLTQVELVQYCRELAKASK